MSSLERVDCIFQFVGDSPQFAGNSSVTDITIQRFLETLGANFIYLQVLNLKAFTAITIQSSHHG